MMRRFRSRARSRPSTRGIVLVHQEILLAEDLTVAQNLFLGREVAALRLRRRPRDARAHEGGARRTRRSSVARHGGAPPLDRRPAARPDRPRAPRAPPRRGLRRADRGAHADRGRKPLRGHPPPQGAGRRRPLHLPPPQRGEGDRRPRHRAAGRPPRRDARHRGAGADRDGPPHGRAGHVEALPGEARDGLGRDRAAGRFA